MPTETVAVYKAVVQSATDATIMPTEVAIVLGEQSVVEPAVTLVTKDDGLTMEPAAVSTSCSAIGNTALTAGRHSSHIGPKRNRRLNDRLH